MNTCKICNSYDEHKTYVVPEMMFGFPDNFQYFECANCGCLQIIDIPVNLAKYYPSNYYSYSKPNPVRRGWIKLFLKRQRLNYFLTGEKNLLGYILTKKYGPPELPFWVRQAELQWYYDILDVGSGAGSLLCSLRDEGFCKLTGVDPFIEEDIFYKNKVRIYKKHVSKLDGHFEFIMLNHSFEHIEDPLSLLRDLRRIIKPNRFILIRVPTVSSFAWRQYGTNWVQLDAPRHFFLHSLRSMEILAEHAGLAIDKIDYDSTDLQFWGSEQYIRNIPFTDTRSYFENPGNSIFSQDDIMRFQERAKELNMSNAGDQACFYMKKI